MKRRTDLSGRIPSRGSDQFVVRFPDGMRDSIKERADRNRRSMNSEILEILEAALGASENGDGANSLEGVSPVTGNQTAVSAAE